MWLLLCIVVLASGATPVPAPPGAPSRPVAFPRLIAHGLPVAHARPVADALPVAHARPVADARPASYARPAFYAWPVEGSRVVRRFDPPARPWLAGHRGVDLAAPAGATVRAAGAGTVLHAGLIAGRGVVSVAHPGGLRTTYEPLHVDPRLRPGAPVAEGAPLGTLAPAHPGCPAVACLHWGLRRGAAYLDPLTLLGLGRVRLLPLAASRPAWRAAA